MTADDLRSDSAYAEGYHDALDDTPLFDGASEAYKAGWQAAMEAREMLRKAGFAETGLGQFSKTIVIDREDTNAG